jgi:DNA-binding response OmpR family regulator
MAENRPKVLIVENDNALGKLLKESLESKKYRVEWQQRADSALELYQKNTYDILLVDTQLEGMTGLDFGKQVRKNDFTTPILFMSAKDDDSDMIEAFCSGGDDYIVKPFTTTELALRVYALLRRTNPRKVESKRPELMQFGKFTFDFPNRVLCTPLQEISLTKKEAEVLRMLALNINNVVKRETVLTDVWGENDYFMGRSMDVYIARLRKKLSIDERVSIVNVHRMGFKLEVRPTLSS